MGMLWETSSDLGGGGGVNNCSCYSVDVCILLDLLVSLMHQVYIKTFCIRHQPHPVEWSSSNLKVGRLIPSLPKNLHAEVSLSKMLNPEMCLIEQQSAANRCTV